ncbi:ABC transporter permease [Mycolicibacterium mucogenicum]|uniref:ABC transporter permease n=1 Tax=Mycolicibacterium mucogenicum TaxID=56689 RepID=UPI000ABAC0C7|nr:ABC transporter permease [Mycolicibacterium mucogenicum]
MTTTVDPPETDKPASGSLPLPRLPQSYPPLVRALLIRAVALGAFLLAWWAVTAAKLIDPLFLPSPGAVWEAFVRANSWHQIAPGVPREVLGEQNYFLWEHLIASLQRILAGVGVAILVGPPLGFLMGTVRPIAIALEPYLNFLRALPPLGYIGLLIVWFGIGDTSKIWLLFLAAFPAITVSTLGGVQSVPSGWVNAASSLGATRWHTVWHVIFPASLPSVVNGIRLAVGFAWTTVVAAELNNGIPGIGGLAFYAGQQTNTPLTIACIIVIGITALALDAAIKYLGELATPWQGKA